MVSALVTGCASAATTTMPNVTSAVDAMGTNLNPMPLTLTADLKIFKLVTGCVCVVPTIIEAKQLVTNAT